MITARRVLISLLLGASMAGLFYAFTRPTDNQQPALRDSAVKHVEPAPGDRVLRQTEVAVDLDPEYTGVLFIDDRRIPEDQVDRIVGLNRISFTPGPEKELETISPGHHCAKVELWQTTVPDAAHRIYTWCFDTH